MKTNKIMDEIRSNISPEMKLQMELSVAIANRIYDILEARGMSQKDFAKLMGKTETEVSRWLSGTHNLTMATICKISAALDAEVVKVADYELEPAIAQPHSRTSFFDYGYTLLEDIWIRSIKAILAKLNVSQIIISHDHAMII